MRLEIYERAVALNDDCPDDVCPGCQQPVAGHDNPACEWTHDHFLARAFRRRYIARWEQAA